MYLELKENKPHGTKSYPYTQYHIHTPRNAFHIPVHWHDEVELVYVKRGRVSISIQEEVFHATAEDLFFVNTGDVHFMESDDMTVEYYTILFPLEFVSFQTDDALEEDIFEPLRQKKIRFPQKIEDERLRKQLIDIVRKIVLINSEKRNGYQLRTRILLLELIEDMIVENCFEQTDIRNATEMQRELITFVQKHYTDKITLSMLAKEFHLSEKYISWYFKERFSISFIQYVSYLRMTRAKDLLNTTDLPITEIALICGYPSVNLFIRKFKELNKVTPLQYRKSVIK